MGRESGRILEEAERLCEDELEQEAETIVQGALKSDPTNLELLVKLGTIQARLCKDEEAESTFRKALNNDPDHEAALSGLGRLLDQSLRTDEAEALYRDFLSRNPAGHTVVEDLCRLLLSEERSVEAEHIAREHLKQFSEMASAYDAIRYTLVIIEDQLSETLDDNRESNTATRQLLENLLEQMTVITLMKQELDVSPELDQELLDETSRIVGEIKHVLTGARMRDISIPDEMLTEIDALLKL